MTDWQQAARDAAALSAAPLAGGGTTGRTGTGYKPASRPAPRPAPELVRFTAEDAMGVIDSWERE